MSNFPAKEKLKELIEFTVCDEAFLDILKSKKVLGSSDIQELEQEVRFVII